MTGPTGLTGASLVTLFSRLGTDELLRGFQPASTTAEVERHAEDITQLLRP